MAPQIIRAGCFEEEDFDPTAYNFAFSEDVTEVRAAGKSSFIPLAII